jgi:DNA polymerase IV
VSPGESRTILHVDMDAFFAAVEVLEDPSLAGQAVIVGGAGERGVVASCSYEARAFGVRSAMPSSRARRLCPHAVFVPGRHELYSQYSVRLHEVLTSFTPLVEGIGLDEAFLDVSGSQRLFGDGPTVAAAIRARVRGDLGLWASVGVASCKLIAKLASEEAKPGASPSGAVRGSGVFVVAPGDELAFLHPLPVQSLWGVGPATLRRLGRFGVRTVGDLANLPEATLVSALGSANGQHLRALAWAKDDRAVEPGRAAKSIGHEETFARDRHDAADLHREVVRQADAVAARLRRHGSVGRTITLKVRFGDFRTITRSRTERLPLRAGTAIARIAGELLDGVDVSEGVRLLGVSVSNLTADDGDQLSLDDLQGAGWDDVSSAVDEVRERFGDDAVGPATALGEKGLRLKRSGDQQWGPAEP